MFWVGVAVLVMAWGGLGCGFWVYFGVFWVLSSSIGFCVVLLRVGLLAFGYFATLL